VFKRLIVFLLVFCFIYAFNVQAQPEPTGRRLWEIVEDKYADSIIIGGTTGAWLFGSSTGNILDREFSYVTPENDYKQMTIHPDNLSWNWVASDEWVDHIYFNFQILRMHCPIGPQCSNWAMNDDRTAEELDTNMCVFLDSLCKRYNGTPGFEYMDVVNETVVSGNWHMNKPGTGWECPWYIIGLDTHDVPVYIVNAFKICDSLAPDIKLIYNHHEEPSNTASWNLIKETVLYLKGLGLRVDGIGWQAHVDVGWESASRLNDLRNLIDWAHSNDLEFHVTEASVWIKTGDPEESFGEQGVTYRSILDVLLEKRTGGKVGWNVWNIDDVRGWNPQWYGSLFDDNYAAKPAYYAIQAALEGKAGIEDLPKGSSMAFKLYNSPNPFNSITSITFELPRRSQVNLSVYNLAGQEVVNLVSEDRDAGNHTVEWNAEGLSTGIYFCLMEAEGIVLRNRMIIVK
jgi:endo-1,4-beta-xylanase